VFLRKEIDLRVTTVRAWISLNMSSFIRRKGLPGTMVRLYGDSVNRPWAMGKSAQRQRVIGVDVLDSSRPQCATALAKSLAIAARMNGLSGSPSMSGVTCRTHPYFCPCVGNRAGQLCESMTLALYRSGYEFARLLWWQLVVELFGG
jgi:hypothetical protein